MAWLDLVRQGLNPRHVASLAREVICFAEGYREFRRSEVTPVQSYQSLRRLYCLTNGRFNDTASWLLSRLYHVDQIPADHSILGDTSDQKIMRIVADLQTSGFHVFDRKLPMEAVRELRK